MAGPRRRETRISARVHTDEGVAYVRVDLVARRTDRRTEPRLDLVGRSAHARDSRRQHPGSQARRAWVEPVNR